MTATTTSEVGEKVSDDTFFRIYGAGRKKALEKELKVKVAGQNILFTAKNLEPIQTMLDLLVEDNDRMYVEISSLRAQVARITGTKVRIRVKARSMRTAA